MADKGRIAVDVGRIERKGEPRHLFALAFHPFMVGGRRGSLRATVHCRLWRARIQLPSVHHLGTEGWSLFHLRASGVYREKQK